MLEFKQEYFKEEVREGFCVPEMMKRAWAGELQVLADVIAVCQKYHLTYFADYGTLLGAVRHKGFIPWDDDIDIALKREDYRKLFEVLPKELPDFYGINSVYTDENHAQPWGSVTNGRELSIDNEAHARQFYGCPYIVGIDIYPLDYIPRDAQMAETQLELYCAVYDAAQRYEELLQTGEMKEILPQIEALCHRKINDKKPVAGQLWKLADNISGLFREEESDDLTLLARIAQGDVDFRLKKEWYADTISMPFENLMIAVPAGYDKILTRIYGDYRTPVQMRAAHDYPFYKKQEAFLEKLRKQSG